MDEKYWEDFEVDEKIESISITITETHVVNWAHLTLDLYPLHMDQEFAQKTTYEGRIVHGPFTFALAVGLVGSSGIFGNSILAWLGVENMRIPLPVRLGDTVHVVAKVLSKRETKKSDRGIIVFEYDVKNQREESVMILDYLLMMHRMGSERGGQ